MHRKEVASTRAGFKISAKILTVLKGSMSVSLSVRNSCKSGDGVLQVHEEFIFAFNIVSTGLYHVQTK